MTASAAERLHAECIAGDSPLSRALPGIMTCVHCGFCLQACPTYLALGEENDSPRGRILLMRALVEGELSPHDADVHTHIDRCLGCRACETACPSGVPYGQLLEATRATLRDARPLAPIARLILWVFARPRVLAAALLLSRVFRATGVPALLARLPGRAGFAFAMLASTRRAIPARPYTRRGSGAHGDVAILEGCVMKGLFAETNRATGRVLVANDYAVVEARGQRCCGALHAHAGDLETARALARANIAAFESAGAATIVVNASGCGAAMRDYGHLLADDPEWAARAEKVSSRVRDVSELLAATGPRRGGPLPLRVTYDAPCHLLHAQRVVRPPLAVLDSIPELERVGLPDAEHCCGSAGIYNLIEPDVAQAVLAPKLANIAATGASVVVTGNPGCLMQIGAGLLRAGIDARVAHPVDVLDASYAAHAP